MPDPLVLHLAPLGVDQAEGSATAPLRSLEAALARVRPQLGRRDVELRLLAGCWNLEHPLRLAETGSAEHPLVIAAAPGAEAVLSGAVPLRLDWRAGADGIWRAAVPGLPEIDGLIVAGHPMPMAGYPKRGWAADALAPARVARWRDPRGGHVHALHEALWGGMHFRITGKKADGSLAWEGGWQNNRPSAPHPDFLRVEGIREELSDPGEWFHDAAAGELLHIPAPGVDLLTAPVAVVRQRHLVEFAGARHVILRGVVLRHAARTFMDTREPLLRSDWRLYRGGAVVFREAEGCVLEDCTIEACGGNGVVLDGWNRHIAVRGCLLRDLGASGVVVVGAADCVRSPLNAYHLRQDQAALDRTPGPRSDRHPQDCTVEDCLIQRLGLVEKQAAGVQLSRSRRITVRQCTIHDVPRAGINVNEGSFGGHLIEGCDVFATVLETGDHGAFNAWGRDRFWDADRGVMQAWVDADPALPFLDAGEPTVLRRNRWRCDHGWDIDLDDGSGNYLIEDNLCLRGGLKLREGWGRTVVNNLLIGCTLHPHVWPERNGDVVQRNIVMQPYAPIGMPAVWGASWDANLLPDAAALAAARAEGRDVRSLAGDPGLLDPARGDYGLRAGSPAWALGWRAIPMDAFGVTSPRLRALAGRPEFPVPSIGAGAVATAPEHDWLGARIRSVTTDGEVSAAGLSRAAGVLLVAVPEGSAAAAAGLQSHDVIIAAAGQALATAEQLVGLARPLELTIRRYQADRPLRIA